MARNKTAQNDDSAGLTGNGSGRTATVPRPAARVPVVSPGPGIAPGERLAGAFASVESFPVSVDARERVMEVAASATGTGDLVAAIQADLGLVMAVVRSASRASPRSGGVSTVAQALKILKPSGVLATAVAAPSFDPLGLGDPSTRDLQRIRSHALATENAMRDICLQIRVEDPAEAAVGALMHDIGRLIIVRLHPDYSPEREFARRTPEQRIKSERERYGIDHALAGGLLARRWDLPNRLAVAIERHHNENAEGLAALIGLADQVAHHRAGDAVSLDQLTRYGSRVGLDEKGLRSVLAGQTAPHSSANGPAGEPCPLSERERDALVKLSEGKVYKQIAEELNLSVSTVRTHLHNIYRKLEVVDRAQAVIKAREQGWV